MASTTPAVSIVRPVADGGPAKNGRKPRYSCSQSWTGTMYWFRTLPPHSPNTTLGMAASRSIT